MNSEILKKYSKLDPFNVSRETCYEFENLINVILEKNNQINIISKKNANNQTIRERHIIDSAQIIDFIDLNNNTTYDLGSGGGMPGLVIAIMLKNLKKKMKLILYEKSYHKSAFLREVSRSLELDIEVIQDDVFKANNLKSGTVMARAFKPLPVILDLVNKNFTTYKNLILFMGKNGREILKKTLTQWDLEFTEKKSVTSEGSFLLNIKNMKKKFLN
jgi:16S rRNA (guanine527-N7)-methyltransferase